MDLEWTGLLAAPYPGPAPDPLIVVSADHGHTSQIVEPQTATTARVRSPR